MTYLSHFFIYLFLLLLSITFIYLVIIYLFIYLFHYYYYRSPIFIYLFIYYYLFICSLSCYLFIYLLLSSYHSSRKIVIHLSDLIIWSFIGKSTNGVWAHIEKAERKAGIRRERNEKGNWSACFLFESKFFTIKPMFSLVFFFFLIYYLPWFIWWLSATFRGHMFAVDFGPLLDLP